MAYFEGWEGRDHVKAALLYGLSGIAIGAFLVEPKFEERFGTDDNAGTPTASAEPGPTAPQRITIPGANVSCDNEIITISINAANHTAGGNTSFLKGLDMHYNDAPQLNPSKQEAYALVNWSAERSGIEVSDPDNVPDGEYKVPAHCNGPNMDW